jgi:hypothetical protein
MAQLTRLVGLVEGKAAGNVVGTRHDRHVIGRSIVAPPCRGVVSFTAGS